MSISHRLDENMLSCPTSKAHICILLWCMLSTQDISAQSQHSPLCLSREQKQVCCFPLQEMCFEMKKLTQCEINWEQVLECMATAPVLSECRDLTTVWHITTSPQDHRREKICSCQRGCTHKPCNRHFLVFEDKEAKTVITFLNFSPFHPFRWNFFNLSFLQVINARIWPVFLSLHLVVYKQEEEIFDRLTVTQRKEEEEVWFVPTSFGFLHGNSLVSQGAKKRAYVKA